MFISACASVSLAPLQPVLPTPGARIISHRPRFLFTRAAHVQIEICRDADCAQPLANFTADGNSAVSPVDLPLGTCYWRMREVGAAPSATRKMNVDVRVSIEGRHTIVEVPELERVTGERLSALLDREVEFLADYLDTKAPKEKLKVVTYVTPGALGIIHDSAAHSYVGFADSNPDKPLELEMSLLAAPAGARHGWGDFESTVAHEIAHRFQQHAFFNYSDLPLWWVEGFAEWVVSKLLGPGQPPLAIHIDSMREAFAKERASSVRSLLYAIDEVFRDSDAEGLHYDEAYTLLRAAEARDPEKFRTLARRIARMPKIPPFSVFVNERFLSALGGAAELETAWRALVEKEELGPWKREWGELRAVSAQNYEIEAHRNSRALAVVRRAAGDSVSLSFTAGAKGVGVAISIKPGARTVIYLPNDGAAELRGEQEKAVHAIRLATGEHVSLGNSLHQLKVERNQSHVVVQLDGNPVLQFYDAEPFGAWGVLVDDGIATVRLAE